jgi:hypothetical protein
MQNVHVVSRPKFHVLSNGDLGFAVRPILCAGKWTKLFTETAFAFKLPFLAYWTGLTGKPSASFEGT